MMGFLILTFLQYGAHLSKFNSIAFTFSTLFMLLNGIETFETFSSEPVIDILIYISFIVIFNFVAVKLLVSILVVLYQKIKDRKQIEILALSEYFYHEQIKKSVILWWNLITFRKPEGMGGD
jgi:hypothetical protein